MSLCLKRSVVGVALTLALVSCAVVPPNSGENPADPWETLNRQTYAFNAKFDELILHPLAVNYVEYVPSPMRTGVTNFFNNTGEPSNVINNFLQGKVGDGFVSIARFLINTTIGVLGIFDVASHMSLTFAPEDFGQTLGVWGMPQGPFIVLPMFGYSTVRDGIGLAASTALNPLTYIGTGDNDYHWVPYVATGIFTVNLRAELLPTDAMVNTALDPYVAVRDAYLQHRLSVVWDGNPPIELPVDEFEDEDFQ